MTTNSEKYEPPTIDFVGTFETITRAGQSGSKADDNFDISAFPNFEGMLSDP